MRLAHMAVRDIQVVPRARPTQLTGNYCKYHWERGGWCNKCGTTGKITIYKKLM